MTDLKDQIATNFSAAASAYDQYAVMQQQAALALTRRLSEIHPQVPEGPLLEVGCGTGALSRGVVTLFPGRRLTLIDLAPGMIAKNRQSLRPLLPSPALVDWKVQDAETITVRHHYALIASCLTLQWFQDLPGTLARLAEALLPGGLLLCSFPGDDSFPEWRRICQTLALPCTINPLPNGREVLEMVHSRGYEASLHQETLTIPYPTVRGFLRSFKKTGTCTALPRPIPAGIGLHGAARLTPSQMARLLAAWQGEAPGPVTVTYRINTLLVRS